jgi:hypothetical protein
MVQLDKLQPPISNHSLNGLAANEAREMADFLQNKAEKLLNKFSGSKAKPSKRGLAWPVENQDEVFVFTKPGSKVSWICKSSGMIFVRLQKSNPAHHLCHR